MSWTVSWNSSKFDVVGIPKVPPEETVNVSPTP